MPKFKVISGPRVVKIFIGFGFTVASQRGSHVKLRRVLKDETTQILTIPLHKELDKGILKTIYRQALRYISESDLRRNFYTT